MGERPFLYSHQLWFCIQSRPIADKLLKTYTHIIRILKSCERKATTHQKKAHTISLRPEKRNQHARTKTVNPKQSLAAVKWSDVHKTWISVVEEGVRIHFEHIQKVMSQCFLCTVYCPLDGFGFLFFTAFWSDGGLFFVCVCVCCCCLSVLCLLWSNFLVGILFRY